MFSCFGGNKNKEMTKADNAKNIEELKELEKEVKK